MLRFRSAVLAVSFAALAMTGCGGSSDAPPPAAAPAAPAPAASAPGSATPVSAPDASSTGAIGSEVQEERAAAKKALRKWGRQATRVCRKAERAYAPHLARIRAVGRQGKSVDLESAGRVFESYAKAAEREYDLVRKIAMPQQPHAVDTIDAFFQKEEEALMLLQRAALELRARNDRPSFVRTAARFRDLLDDYRKSARAAHAEACYD